MRGITGRKEERKCSYVHSLDARIRSNLKVSLCVPDYRTFSVG